jgi:hypothetical protein
MLVEDSVELHLIPFLAVVTVQPPKNGYGETNKIGYKPLEGVASAPPNAPPTPAPQSGAGFKTAPWKRTT